MSDRNYREIIDKILDLENPGDLDGLARACENTAAMLRMAIATQDKRKEREQFAAKIAPWFTPAPSHRPCEQET